MLKNKEYKVTPATIACGVIVVLMMLFVLFTGNKTNNKKEVKINNDDIVELFNKITNNYEMKIIETVNTKKQEYLYHNDGKIEIYETSSIDYINVVYNNKVYKMDSNNMKITNIIDVPYYINNPYTNFELIKKIINKCDFKYESKGNVSCELLVTDYINEYNNYYGLNLNSASSKYINLNITYNSKIRSIDIDYTNANMILNENDDIINYKLTFSNIDTNDYSEIIDYLKNEIK